VVVPRHGAHAEERTDRHRQDRPHDFLLCE
jgi:hypothetical protein